MGCKNSISALSEEEFSDDWRVTRTLGEGVYAKVYVVKHKKSSRTAALKMPKTCDDRNAKMEVNIWRKIGKHAHIVDLIDDFVIAGSTAILMERCGSNLSQHMSSVKMGHELPVARMLNQMVSAVAHMHSLSIVHRDIKEDNFLCSGGDPILKLCDFGFATMMPTSGQLFGRYGTPLYMSPEMVKSGPHDLKTDVWSLGVIFYRMLYGDFPYSPSPRTAKNVLEAIASGTLEPSYEGQGFISCEAKATAIALLNRRMSARPSASRVLESPFLRSAFEKSSMETSLKPSEGLVDILDGSQSSCDTYIDDESDMTYSMTYSISVNSKSTSKPRLMSL